MPKYECDCCGACCQGHLIVEAYDIDLRREPRLLQADPRARDQSMDESLAVLEDDGKCLLIACGTNRPCAFLGGDNRCSIYPTRPNACVVMQAGDDQCQMARKDADLPPLQSIEG